VGVNRRWLPWLGGFLFVVAQLLVVLFGIDGLAEPRVALQYGTMTLAALLLLTAGVRERYAVAGLAVRWNHLAGVSMALLGAGLTVSYLAPVVEGVRGGDAAFAVVAAVGSLTLVWFGYQVAYATRHVRLDPDPREE
jgi:hypothetical protein